MWGRAARSIVSLFDPRGVAFSYLVIIINPDTIVPLRHNSTIESFVHAGVHVTFLGFFFGNELEHVGEMMTYHLRLRC